MTDVKSQFRPRRDKQADWFRKPFPETIKADRLASQGQRKPVIFTAAAFSRALDNR
jgi:hypothetical protein